MTKYLVSIKFDEWGTCEVEAENKEEAKEKARQMEMDGNLNWGDRDEVGIVVEEQGN